MKIEVTPVTETITRNVMKFIAVDGKVFPSEPDCRAYERKLRFKELGKRIETIEQCVELKDCFPLDGCEYLEDHDYYWYRPKTLDEIQVLREYYEIVDDIADWEPGEWICVEVSFDDAYAAPISNSLSHIHRFLEALGYEVSITKKGVRNSKENEDE